MNAPDDDFGWFSPADLEIVLKAIAKYPDPDKLVLVGGQSLVRWMLYYDIPVPQADYPALTQDVDFIGARKEAEFLAKELGGTVRFATIDDHTPNTAVITWQPPGAEKKKLLLDFLSGILGVADADLHRLAVDIQFPGQGPLSGSISFADYRPEAAAVDHFAPKRTFDCPAGKLSAFLGLAASENARPSTLINP